MLNEVNRICWGGDYMNFTEEQLISWSKPLSETEEQRCQNALNMIKNAINESDKPKNKNIEYFLQGSYSNNTNVRTNSDVDICIMYKNVFYGEYPNGKLASDYGFTSARYTFDEYKAEILTALKKKFSDIEVGNKSLKIDSNSYRVQADAVPAFQYRNYSKDYLTDANNYIEGICIISKRGEKIINYPKQHKENGINKNTRTSNYYKKMVRIIKKIKYDMKGTYDSVENISSFVLECIVYNVPDYYFSTFLKSESSKYQEMLKEIILYIENNINENWKEVNEIKLLFNSDDKRIDYYRKFIKDIKKYIGI